MTKNRTPTPVYLDPGMHSGLEVKGLNINTFRISFTGVIVSFTGVFCWFYWSILLVLLAYLINLDNYHTR